VAIPAALHGSATKATAPMSHGCHGETLLVGGAITSLKNMSSSMGRMTSHMENKKCLKPPTRLLYYVAVVALGFGMFGLLMCAVPVPACYRTVSLVQGLVR